MEMLNRTTEPCYLKSKDCVAKLNTKFLLIEIKPWLNTGFSLCHKLVVCAAFPPAISRANAVVLRLCSTATSLATETLMAGKYQRCVPFKVSRLHLQSEHRHPQLQQAQEVGLGNLDDHQRFPVQ